MDQASKQPDDEDDEDDWDGIQFGGNKPKKAPSNPWEPEWADDLDADDWDNEKQDPQRLPHRSDLSADQNSIFSICVDDIRSTYADDLEIFIANEKGSRGQKLALDNVSKDVYRLLCHVIDQQIEYVFDRFLTNHRSINLDISGHNLLNRGFSSIFNGSYSVDRRLKSRCVHEMFYAYCHYIPPAFLSAFTTEMGPTAIASQIRLKPVRDRYNHRYEEWATVQMNLKRGGKYLFSHEAYRRRKLANVSSTDDDGEYRDFGN